MSNDWRFRPTIIDNWDPSINTILAIDENGTTDLLGVREYLLKNSNENNSSYEHHWFTITGVSFERENFSDFVDAVNTIKYAYWEDGCFNYKNGNKRVVFHSREIRKKEGPFNPKIINHDIFIKDITSMIEKTPFTIYSSSIDKIKHVKKYFNPWHVYQLCLEFILERFCQSLKCSGKTGIILLEARGKKEDKEILDFLCQIFNKGTRYRTSADFECIKGVYFNPKRSKKHDEKQSYILLELADLVSYPIHKYVKYDVKDEAYNVIEKKIHNYPMIYGYGLKIFP